CTFLNLTNSFSAGPERVETFRRAKTIVVTNVIWTTPEFVLFSEREFSSSLRCNASLSFIAHALPPSELYRQLFLAQTPLCLNNSLYGCFRICITRRSSL